MGRSSGADPMGPVVRPHGSSGQTPWVQWSDAMGPVVRSHGSSGQIPWVQWSDPTGLQWRRLEPNAHQPAEGLLRLAADGDPPTSLPFASADPDSGGEDPVLGERGSPSNIGHRSASEPVIEATPVLKGGGWCMMRSSVSQ